MTPTEEIQMIPITDIATQSLAVDLTGHNPHPVVEVQRWNQGGGHGGMSWPRTRAVVTFKLAAAVKPGSEHAQPGSLGTFQVTLSVGDLERLRDACTRALDEATARAVREARVPGRTLPPGEADALGKALA